MAYQVLHKRKSMIEVQKAVKAINKNPNNTHWLQNKSFVFNYVGLFNKNKNKQKTTVFTQFCKLNAASFILFLFFLPTARSFGDTVIFSFKTVRHITSSVRGFSESLSLSVWQLHVAFGKQHHIISRRL